MERVDGYVQFVDRILDAKRADPSADISDLKRPVDVMITKFYGLMKGK